MTIHFHMEDLGRTIMKATVLALPAPKPDRTLFTGTFVPRVSRAAVGVALPLIWTLRHGFSRPPMPPRASGSGSGAG